MLLKESVGARKMVLLHEERPIGKTRYVQHFSEPQKAHPTCEFIIVA